MGEKWHAIGNSLGNMLGTWELFDLTPSPKKLASKVDYPLCKWKVNNGQSILHPEHNLTTKKIPSHPPTKKRVAPSLHDMTSLCLYGNSCSKIGFHYFWFGLLEVIIEQNDPHNRHPWTRFCHYKKAKGWAQYMEKGKLAVVQGPPISLSCLHPLTKV